MKMLLATTLILVFFTVPMTGAGAELQPVVFLGSFSNMRATEEHQYGIEVRLWREGTGLFGFFSFAAGLSGDTPTGRLADIRFDPETGKLSFRAKLTVGRHYCKLHQGGPSQDLFTFQGILTPASLSGDLQHFEALHPEKPLEEEKVVLHKVNRQDGRRTDYQSRSQWERETQEMLRRLGPKW
jgi:hypothetical protein